MGDSEALELTKRLERVERDVRRYRVALAALGLVVLAAGILVVRAPDIAAGILLGFGADPVMLAAARFAVLAGALLIVFLAGFLVWGVAAGGLNANRPAGASGTPAVIQARQFQVVDGAGKRRASLGVAGDNVRLVLYDKAEKVRAGLATHGDDVVLAFPDKAGKLRAVLGMVDDAPALRLYDKAEKERARLEVRGDNVGLWFHDKAGKLGAVLGVAGDNVRLDFLDKAGNVRASLVTGGDDVGLELSDKAGNTRAALGNGDLKDTRTGSTEHRAASSLVLFSEKGKVLWEAP